MATHRDAQRLPLREHGELSADSLTALGVSRAQIIDLASTHNPYGPPEAIAQALMGVDPRHYPDATALPARRALADRFATTPEQVVLGHGANELIWSSMRVLLRASETALVVEPGHPELGAAVRACGARVLQWRSVERTGHRVDLDQIGELLLLEKPALVALCAPATPSGVSVPWDELHALAVRFPETRFVIDQSQLALSEDFADLERLPAGNMVCIRSLGKELGLDGVRVGYMLAHPSIAARVEACRPAFSTSASAQAVALAAASDRTYLDNARQRLLQDRARTSFVLQKLGLPLTPSVTSYQIVRIARAAEVADELLTQHRVHVHACGACGLPDHIRLSGVREADERTVEAALREVLERRKLRHGRDA